MSRRHPLTYGEHQACALHLWRAGERAAICYDLARQRCQKQELRLLIDLFCTPSRFDAVKHVMDAALFADVPVSSVHSWHDLGGVYYSVSARFPDEAYHFSGLIGRRRTPLTDAQYAELGLLLEHIRADALAAWKIAVQRYPLKTLCPLERIWRTTVDKLGLCLERKRYEDAQKGICRFVCWPW